MLHRRRDQQTDDYRHENECGDVQRPVQNAKLVEGILKRAIEMKAEEHLSAKNQQACFIQSCLDACFQCRHRDRIVIELKGSSRIGVTFVSIQIDAVSSPLTLMVAQGTDQRHKRNCVPWLLTCAPL
jgi:hypothetical protein